VNKHGSHTDDYNDISILGIRFLQSYRVLMNLKLQHLPITLLLTLPFSQAWIILNFVATFKAFHFPLLANAMTTNVESDLTLRTTRKHSTSR
jgi:hypothetical protein